MSARALLPLAVLALATLGCETLGPRYCDRSDEENPFVPYTEGTVENGVYMSSPWDGELLFFPGGQHFALAHGLGETPRWAVSYLSFSKDGVADGGSVAQAAGNQAVIVGMDAEEIRIKNDSCVDYWLLVTAGAGESPTP